MPPSLVKSWASDRDTESAKDRRAVTPLASRALSTGATPVYRRRMDDLSDDGEITLDQFGPDSTASSSSSSVYVQSAPTSPNLRNSKGKSPESPESSEIL